MLDSLYKKNFTGKIMAIQGIAIDAVFSGYNGQSAVQFAKFGANGTYSDPQGVPLTSLEGLRVIPSMTGGKSVVREGDIIVSQYMVQEDRKSTRRTPVTSRS